MNTNETTKDKRLESHKNLIQYQVLRNGSISSSLFERIMCVKLNNVFYFIIESISSSSCFTRYSISYLCWTARAVPYQNEDHVLYWTAHAVPYQNEDTVLYWTAPAVPYQNEDHVLYWTAPAVPYQNEDHVSYWTASAVQ